MKNNNLKWCIWIKYEGVGWCKEATFYPVAGYSAKWISKFYLRHIYKAPNRKTERVLLEGKKPSSRH